MPNASLVLPFISIVVLARDSFICINFSDFQMEFISCIINVKYSICYTTQVVSYILYINTYIWSLVKTSLVHSPFSLSLSPLLSPVRSFDIPLSNQFIWHLNIVAQIRVSLYLAKNIYRIYRKLVLKRLFSLGLVIGIYKTDSYAICTQFQISMRTKHIIPNGMKR